MKRLLNLPLGFFVFLALFLSFDPLTESHYIYAEYGECEFVEVPKKISSEDSEKKVPITIKNKTDNKTLTYKLIYHEPVGETIPSSNSPFNTKSFGPQTVGPGEIITFYVGPLKPGPYIFYAVRPQATAPDCQSTQVGLPPQTRVEPQPRPASKPLLCNSDNGIETAIGCIPIRDTNAFVGWFLRWAVGLGGGIAFLMIVFSAFQIMTAGNNPQQLQGGRELLTAAISGLILIIFSVFLLKLIGVQILNIPGFG